jgi:ribonuclease R
VEAWLKCYYMQDRIGEVFDGTISGVTAFGAFVTLDQVYVEGLVHISELGTDYFHHDPVRHCLIGERTKQQYRVGDRLRVKLVRADLESNRIDFVPATAIDEAVQPTEATRSDRDALAQERSRKTGRPVAVERHLLDVEMDKGPSSQRKKGAPTGTTGTPAGKSRVLGRHGSSGKSHTGSGNPAGKSPSKGKTKSKPKAKPAAPTAVKSRSAPKPAAKPPAKPAAKDASKSGAAKSKAVSAKPVAKAKAAAKSNAANRSRRAKT